MAPNTCATCGKPFAFTPKERGRITGVRMMGGVDSDSRDIVYLIARVTEAGANIEAAATSSSSDCIQCLFGQPPEVARAALQDYTALVDPVVVGLLDKTLRRILGATIIDRHGRGV